MAYRQKEYMINAGLFRRTAAFVLDLLLLNFLVLDPFRNLFRNMLPSMDFGSVYSFVMQNEIFMDALFIGSISIGAIVMLYFILMEWKLGQTVGKMIFGMHVVALENNSKNNGSISKKGITFWQALLRNIYLLPIFPFFLLLIIDPIYMLFNKDRQRLSERISKSKVVEKYLM